MYRREFSGLFVEVLPSSTLRMVPSILHLRQPRYLSLWWFQEVWFREVFSFSWGILLNFFLSSRMLDDVFFQYSQVIVSFLFYECPDFFLILVVLFISIVLNFSLLAEDIFLCQIPFIYHHCISALFVLGFPILSHFWQTVWCHPCTLGDWFFPRFINFVSACTFLKWVSSSLFQIVMVIVHLPGRLLSGFSPQLSFSLLLSVPLTSFPLLLLLLLDRWYFVIF